MMLWRGIIRSMSTKPLPGRLQYTGPTRKGAEMDERMELEIRRQVRFWFEERYPDDWSLDERIYDSIRMLEDVLDWEIIDQTQPLPDIVYQIANEFDSRYTAARSEYAKWYGNFLSKIGPEMDI